MYQDYTQIGIVFDHESFPAELRTWHWQKTCVKAPFKFRIEGFVTVSCEKKLINSVLRCGGWTYKQYSSTNMSNKGEIRTFTNKEKK